MHRALVECWIILLIELSPEDVTAQTLHTLWRRKIPNKEYPGWNRMRLKGQKSSLGT